MDIVLGGMWIVCMFLYCNMYACILDWRYFVFCVTFFSRLPPSFLSFFSFLAFFPRRLSKQKQKEMKRSQMIKEREREWERESHFWEPCAEVVAQRCHPSSTQHQTWCGNSSLAKKEKRGANKGKTKERERERERARERERERGERKREMDYILTSLLSIQNTIKRTRGLP